MRATRSAAFGLLSLLTAAWTSPVTVTLDIPGMTCTTCPITVKSALKKIPGVTDVTVSYERREAVVTFDDSRTNSAALITATTNAGFPSTVKRIGTGASTIESHR